MIRFGKPDGSSFDFDYTGAIHAFDAGNDLIAICPPPEEYEEDGEKLFIPSDPGSGEDWEILIDVKHEEIMAMALASAYTACMLCQRMVERDIAAAEDAA